MYLIGGEPALEPGKVFLFKIMANGKNSIIVYRDWINIFDPLTDKEAGKLIKHFFKYVNDQNPEPPDRITKLMFVTIKDALKRDLKKWEGKSEKNRESALKRWDKNNTNASERIKRNAKNADSDNDNDNDNDSDNDNVIKEKKKTYLEFVKLTQSDYDSLLSAYGENRLNGMIEILNDYIGQSGKRYKSHKHVLSKNGWVYNKFNEGKKSNEWPEMEFDEHGNIKR